MPTYNRTAKITVVTESDESAIAVSTSAYTANDCVGALLAAPGIDGSGLIRKIKILDKAAQSEPYKIHFFDQQPSTIANDAAMALSDADGQKKIGQITITATNYTSENGGAFTVALIDGSDCDIDFRYLPDGKIYIYMECTDTPDYVAATDLEITLWVWLD